MKTISLIALLFSACASTPLAHPPLSANRDYGSISGNGGDVVVVSQWHLSPSTTTTLSSAGLPQAENQRAIYRQLVDWVESGRVRSVIVEGCEGEITDGFSERFNGWTLADLQKLSAEQLDNVMTQIGIKLKAKLGRKVHVECGDKAALIKKHQLILSDLRGLLGFRARIDQYAGDIEKRADYVATARDVLKMPPSSDEDDVLKRIDEDLRARMKDFNSVLRERNASFTDTVGRSEAPSAVVIGALHIEDLVSQLENRHLQVQVFTPRGLKGDEAALLAEAAELLKKPMSTYPSARRVKEVTPQPDSGPAPQ